MVPHVHRVQNQTYRVASGSASRALATRFTSPVTSMTLSCGSPLRRRPPARQSRRRPTGPASVWATSTRRSRGPRRRLRRPARTTTSRKSTAVCHCQRRWMPAEAVGSAVPTLRVQPTSPSTAGRRRVVGALSSPAGETQPCCAEHQCHGDRLASRATPGQDRPGQRDQPRQRTVPAT